MFIRLTFIAFVLFFFTSAQAQNEVVWSFESSQISATEYNIYFKADIKPGWYIYSQTSFGEGPIPTSFIIESGGAKAVGLALECSSHTKDGLDPIFEIRVKKFSESVVFVQRIRVTDPNKPISGYLENMVCDSEKCLPPKDTKFSIALSSFATEGEGCASRPSTKKWGVATALPTPNAGTAAALQNIDSKTKKDTAQAANTIPTTDSTSTLVQTPTNAPQPTLDTALVAAHNNDIFNQKFDNTNATNTCTDAPSSNEEKATGWWIFLFGFGAGFIALLTPCVFPMIPLTVGFFTKRSKDRKTGLRNAIIYGLSIIVIYTGLGLLITLVFGADALNQLSTNLWFNLILFAMLIFFAFSFFGYFELTLPSSWANKMDSLSDKGGLLGIFFMAFTLAIVSFSCTGPLIGNLLVLAVDKGATGLPIKPLLGMFGFSLALALPFALFSFFPGWLQNLPKSGNWMDDVKVTLGFAEIALALKFLSVADLTMGWKILPYEAFIAVWVLCALGLLLYYLNILRFPHTAKRKTLPLGHKLLAGLSFLLLVYFGSGFMKHPRVDSFVTPAMLSGIAPPAGHSYIYPRHCPLDFECYNDFEEGMAVAQTQNKPVLLDFTGHGCVNCRKMEDNVWSKDEVYNLIKKEYVLISLFADDRAPLPQKIEIDQNRSLRNVGNKWAYFQEKYFNRVAQPYYVLLSPDKKVLNQPVPYTPNISDYASFLRCGVTRFKEGK